MNNDNLIQLIYDDIQEVKKRLGGVDERLDGVDKRLDGMDKRFDGMDKRLDGMDERLDGIDERLDGIDERLDGMDKRLDGMDERLDGMDKRFDGMDKRFDRLEKQVQENTDAIRRVNLRIENEIIPSIGFIADGHLDLNRKMDRILETFEKNERDKEAMTLRLNHVEGEVGRLKEKVARLA
ncbi:MAG: hypothetical protein ACI4ED_08355 [Suilimivivens sp.]